MPILVRVTVLAPDDVLRDFGAGALIRLERAASEAGVYAEIDTEAVVAGKYSYEIADASGTSSSWYRTRYSNSADTLQSEYGDPWSPSAPRAYATLDDLLLTRQAVSDTRVLADAERRLEETADDLDEQLHRKYPARPGATETWIEHGTGTDRLHLHDGLISLATVEIRQAVGGSWLELEAQDTGWYLEGRKGELTVGRDEPFFHVVLLPNTAYPTFPKLPQAVRLTGVRGWPVVLPRWREANVAWARQRLAEVPGTVRQGPDDMAAVLPDRPPRAVFDLLAAESQRHTCYT